MLSDIKIRKPLEVDVVFRPHYSRLNSVQVSENGVSTRKSQIEVFDFSKANSQFSFRDFNFENLMAVGATNILVERQMSESNAESFVNSINALSNEINSQKAGQA